MRIDSQIRLLRGKFFTSIFLLAAGMLSGATNTSFAQDDVAKNHIAENSAQENSAAVVKQLIARVSSELDKLYKAKRIGDRPALEQMIRTEIVPHIDREYLARRVYRQFWQQIVQANRQQDAEQRVIDSIVHTYAVALSSYSGDTLSVISVNEEGKKSTARTRIRRPNGELIQVDFSLSNASPSSSSSDSSSLKNPSLKSNAGQWLINDMAVDGIVESLTLHNAIKPIWEQQGMEAALNAVREKEIAPAGNDTKKDGAK